jgi:hypothetical protein
MKKSSLLAAVSLLLAGCASHVIPKRTTAHTSAIATPSAKAGSDDLYPDPDITPGATNLDVTQATIQDTICKSGWTATIRPPAAYTNKLKTDGITQYGFNDVNPKDYEEDHFLPLELGGNPRDPKNLWPEPYNTQINGQRMGAHEKDRVENLLKKQVCSGALTLQEAQDQIEADWYKVYVAHF